MGDGFEDDMTSVVVAMVSVVQVWPVFERERTYKLVTLQKLLS